MKKLLEAKYVLRECVGSGNSGVVYRASERNGDALVAVKIFDCKRRGVEELENELCAYTRLDVRGGPQRRRFARLLAAYLGPEEGYLSMSFLPMSLGAMLEHAELLPLSHRDILSIFTQLAEAVVYMHESGFIHTDLKPSNVMLRSGETREGPTFEEGLCPKRRLVTIDVVVVDFGGSVSTTSWAYSMVGTSAYRPPEVTLALPWNAKVDVFACGCILAELSTGKRLFPPSASPQERMEVLNRVVERIPASLARKGERRIPGLFTFNGETVNVRVPRRNVGDARRARLAMRLTPLLTHPSLDKYKNACFAMLRLDPTVRAGSADMLDIALQLENC